MRRILQRLLPQWQLLSLTDLPPIPEPEETGETYEANARIKALYYLENLNQICLADDAGLEIDALGGAPGVKSRRFGGAESSFQEKIAMILKQLKDTPEPERTARFQCVVALALPEEDSSSHPNCKVHLFSASCEGSISFSPRGEGGFGYDPIFIPKGSHKTFAEMLPEEKDAVSHRGKVLRQVAQWLGENYPLPPEEVTEEPSPSR